MEALILAWYVLVETQSVLMLTLFASLQYVGTLFAPMFGVMGHRIGNKKMLCMMRATYFVLAVTLMLLALTGLLVPWHVFVIAALMGMVRPSDLVMRYALVGETMPVDRLMGATSISRTTQDSARIMGALAGAAIVAMLGMGAAYVAIACIYALSFVLTLRVEGARPVTVASGHATVHIPPSTPWRDLREGLAYVWNTPQLLAAMWLAFLVNLTAFPLTNGLLPYVAKEIYFTDQKGLGYLVASFAFGALLGSIVLSRLGHVIRPARMMITGCLVWYLLLAVFTQMPGFLSASVVLIFVGFAQSLGMVSMSAMLLRTSDARFRSRVMGVRILAVYGVPIGLLVSGPLIRSVGYPATVMLYSAVGLIFTLLIARYWRNHVWRDNAPGNMQ